MGDTQNNCSNCNAAAASAEWSLLQLCRAPTASTKSTRQRAFLRVFFADLFACLLFIS